MTNSTATAADTAAPKAAAKKKFSFVPSAGVKAFGSDVGTVAQMGLLLGVFLGTATLVTAGAGALATKIFGNGQSA